MADALYVENTDDVPLPPAKRARLDGPSHSGADMADTPVAVDDMDDLYGTPTEALATAPTSHTHEREALQQFPIISPGPVMGSIPGLGLISPPAPEPLAVHSRDTAQEEANSNAQLVRRSEEQVASSEGSVSKPVQSLTTIDLDAKTPDGMELVSHTPQPEELKAPSPPQSAADSAQAIKTEYGSRTAINDEGKEQAESTTEVSQEELVPTETSDTLTKPSQLIVEEQVSRPKVTDDEEFMRAAEANQGNPNAEWQFDLSDAETSDTSSNPSDSDSDIDDEDDEDDSILLDPEEQARILMREEANDGDTGGSVSKAPLRTANEKPEERIEKPNVVVTPDMKITELGTVEAVVENLILIKGKTSGEYQVLETGSVLCLSDRTVIGAVAETLGRVQEPRYSVGFSNAAEINEAGITKGTTIYYVDQHSSYVFTQPLKMVKGSDASNMHDEEVLGEEIEFSDDEAEAEYKRNLKKAKQASREAEGGSRGGHASRGRHEQRVNGGRTDYPSGGMNYDDADDTDMYTPLARPENLHQMMNTGREPIEERNPAGRGGRGRFGRGRDDRGGRGRRGHERGGHHNHGDRANRPERAQQSRRGNNERFDRGGRRGSDHRQQPPRTDGPYGYGSAPATQPQSSMPGQPQVYSPPTNQFPFMPLPNQNPYDWAQGNPFFVAPNVSPPPGSAPLSHATPIGPPTSNTLPTGAYLNPAFFARQQQFSQGQQYSYPPQQAYQPQYAPQWSASQQQVQPVPQPGATYPPTSDASAALSNAQGSLAEILRSLTQNAKPT